MPKLETRYSVEISDEYEARIQAGIAKDPNNPKLTDEQLSHMQPATDAPIPAT